VIRFRFGEGVANLTAAAPANEPSRFAYEKRETTPIVPDR
jgi:hypothetical protein